MMGNDRYETRLADLKGELRFLANSFNRLRRTLSYYFVSPRFGNQIDEVDIAMELDPIQRWDLCPTVDAIDSGSETMRGHQLSLQSIVLPWLGVMHANNRELQSGGDHGIAQ